MPFFIDTHKLGDYDRAKLEKSVEDQVDEFGVIIHQMLFNQAEDVLFCLCEAPNKEAVQKHHDTFNVECDKIIEIEHILTEKFLESQKLKVLGEFSSRLAHDLGNSLSVILLNAQIIRKNGSLSSQDKERFTRIEEAIYGMSHQINNVLDYIKNKSIKITQNSFSDILNSAFKEVKVPKNVEVVTIGEDVKFFCDFNGIRVVLVNLLLNSIHAMEDHGTLTISIEDKGKKISFKVQDSGPGFQLQNISKIFEPLYTTKQEGTGLGLASCKTIVNQHYGEIAATDNPAIVTVTIPKKIEE